MRGLAACEDWCAASAAFRWQRGCNDSVLQLVLCTALSACEACCVGLERRAFGIAVGVSRARRLSAYVPEERFVGENQFASISLPLGISIAVGRGRAVSAGQRDCGRCCTSQTHYSFATSLAALGRAGRRLCAQNRSRRAPQPQRAQSARREPQRFARRRAAAAADS